MSVAMTHKSWRGQGLFSPIRIKTPPKDSVKPRRSYSPSWTHRGTLKREELMSRKNEAAKTSDIIAELSARRSKSPISQVNSTRHELLEQQYQDLRKMITAERKEPSKPQVVSSRSQKSIRTLPGSAVYVKSTKSGKSTKSTQSTKSELYVRESVPVKDFLQSSEYGMDHFSKHLSCVKKLAKRYRRHRRPNPKFRAVIEIIE